MDLAPHAGRVDKLEQCGDLVPRRAGVLDDLERERPSPGHVQLCHRVDDIALAILR
ncbi:MAG: hypothetical protein ACJ743_12910 [Gaiellaceae bacterium]